MNVRADMVTRWFREVWCEPRNPNAIDELLADDARIFGVDASAPISKEDFRGIRDRLLASIPDLRIEVTDQVATDERVAFRARATGTHAETGRPVSFAGTGIVDFEGGQVVESHETWDFAAMLIQIGALEADVLANAL